MSNARCPSREELFGYLVGTLPEDLAENVSEHVDSCAQCAETLRTMNDADDQLVASLRAVQAGETYGGEPQQQDVIARVKALAGETTEAWDASPQQAATEPSVQRDLGEYQLLQKVGKGGMGSVYKARHIRLDKLVALKVLPRERMTDPRNVARFEREMKAIGRVDHPHLVRAMDARDIGGTRFLVMEYVEGQNLAEVSRQCGALPTADACELARQVALGLQCVHDNGLIHRDIKPSNVILTPTGLVKILDLGLALLHAEHPAETDPEDMTDTGAAMGTADYVAPEQASDAHSVDSRADIYSLGCTLYKLLAGRPPFSAPQYKSPVDKMTAHLRDKPPSIQVARPDVPAELAQIIERMMAKDRTQRYADAREVAQALAPFAAGADVAQLCAEAEGGLRGDLERDQSRAGTDPFASSALADTASDGLEAPPRAPEPPGARPEPDGEAATTVELAAPLPSPRVVRSQNRWRLPALVALGLLGVAVVAGVIVLRIRDRSGRETVVEIPEGAKAKVGPDGAVEIDLAGAQGEPPTKPPTSAGDTVPSVVSTRRQAVPVEGEEPNLSLLPRRLETPGVGRWHIDTRLPRAEIKSVSWSPDGRLVACRSFDAVRLYEAATGRLVLVFSHRPKLCLDSAFSPDGKWLAIRYSDGNVRLWDVGEGRAGPVFAARVPNSHNVLTWSPDGRQLAACESNKVAVWSVDGNLVHSWDCGEDWLCGWSRDGKWLLVGGRLMTPDGRPGPELDEGENFVKFSGGNTRWSPDGRYLAAEIRIPQKRSSIFVWDANTWKVIRKSIELEPFILNWAWNPANQRLVFLDCSEPVKVKSWSIDDDSYEIIDPSWDARDLWAFSPNGDRIVDIVAGRVEIRFWDAGAKKPRSTLNTGGSPELRLLGVSPDGQWLATKCIDRQKCFLWHGDGRVGPVLPELSARLTAVAWGPNGLLASGHEEAVRVWNATTGDRAWESPKLQQAASILAWSPDGKHLASSGADKTIHVWEVDGNGHVQTAAAHTGTVDQLAWNSDGNEFASLSRADNKVRLWNADAMAGPVLNVGDGPAHQFAWTPDGQHIAVQPKKGPLQLFNTTGEKVLEISNADAFVEWSPDGKWLAAGAHKGDGLRIYSHDGVLRPGPRGEFWEIGSEEFWRPDWRRWSPNSKWLAVNYLLDATIRLWDVKANRYSPVLNGNPKSCSAVCWSPDSRHLLSFNEDQTFRYWDVGSGRILATTVFLRNDQWARITADGKIQTSSPEAEKDLVYVLEEPSGAQKIYDVAEFQALAAEKATGSSIDSRPIPVGDWVPLAKSEDDLKAWQKTGSGTATFADGGVRLQDAGITYPTVALDVTIRVNVKIEVNLAATAKLTLRESAAGSYDAILEDGKRLVVGVTAGETWRELRSAPVAVPQDKSLALEFSVVGDVLTVSVNGKPALEVRDATHRYGSPGVAVVNGSTVLKDIEVKVLRAPDAHYAGRKPAVQPPPPSQPSLTKSDVPSPKPKSPAKTDRPYPLGQWAPLINSENDLAAWSKDGGEAKYSGGTLELNKCAIILPAVEGDVAIRATVKHISGDCGAIGLRSAVGGRPFYAATFTNFGLTELLDVTGRGEYQRLRSATYPEPMSDFVDMEFWALGDKLTLYVRGEEFLTATDSAHARGGLWLEAVGGVTLFRDVQVRVLSDADKKLGRRVVDGAPTPAPLAISPFDAAVARKHQEVWAKHLNAPLETANSIGMNLILIPAGEYEMGLTDEESESLSLDAGKAAPRLAQHLAKTLPLATPRHWVRVSRPFQLGACEVTRAQFQQFVDETGYRTTNEDPDLRTKCVTLHPDFTSVLGSPASWRNPAVGSQDANEPVVNVSLYDAQAFCDWLSRKENADYRLPTEEEWEFACRAGGMGQFGFANDVADVAKHGWTDETEASSRRYPAGPAHAVGQKAANAFGLRDMVGNVHEICARSLYPNQTLLAGQVCLRGGERSLPASAGLHAYRVPLPDHSFVRDVQGFRVVRQIPLSIPTPPDDPVQAERWVANWLLERGAELTIRAGDKTETLSTPQALPPGTFVVESVTLRPSMRFEPEELVYLQKLSNLSVLKLDNPRIGELAARRLVGLKKLREIHVLSSRVHWGPGFKRLGENEGVWLLQFGGGEGLPNDLTCSHLPAFRNLEQVNLELQQYQQGSLKYLASLPKLRDLHLNGASVDDAGLRHLSGLQGLRSLGLHGTRVTDADLSHLATLKNLEYLNLRNTDINGTGLAALAKLDSVRCIWLEESKLTDEGCAALGRLTTLTALFLERTAISDAGLKHLEGLAELRSLNVDRTRTSDVGLASIGKLRRLETLSLWRTMMTDAGVESLRGLTELKTLSLGYTRVGDRTVETCVGFPNLQTLSLYGTYVTDACIEKLGSLKQATKVRLGHTQISSEKGAALKARLPSCDIELPTPRDLTSSDARAVLAATHYSELASAKIRFPDGSTQNVNGKGWESSAEPPFQVLELTAEKAILGDWIADAVKSLTELTLLNLRDTRLTNRGAQDLAGLPTLQTLILDANPIDDLALPHLYGLPRLRSLSLKATRVTPEGVRNLLDKLPQCRVAADFLVTRTGGPLFAQSPVTEPTAIKGLRSWSVMSAAPRDWFSAVACHPSSGEQIAFAGDSGEDYPATVRVWNRKAQNPDTAPVWIGLGHAKTIRGLVWSPNGKYLASTGDDAVVKVWQPATGRCLRTFQLTGPASALAWAPTMDRLLVVLDGSTALLVVKTGEVRWLREQPAGDGIAWSPDGQRFLVGIGDSSTYTLTVYDAQALTPERVIRCEDLTGRSATWSPDGKHLAAALGGRIVRIWDAETCERVRELPLPSGEVQCLAWSPKGERLAGAGRHLTVWDVETGTPAASRELGFDATIGLGWTADAQHITACSSTAIRVYSAGDAMLADELSITGRIPATDLTIQPDGHYRAADAVARRLVYAVLTDDDRQETYTPAAFAAKYGWKNDPSKVTTTPQP